MPQRLEPKLGVLPAAQREIWTSLASVLRSIGYFEDGDLNSLDSPDRELLRNARDRIGQLPDVAAILSQDAAS
jgi:hypothetical protein